MAKTKAFNVGASLSQALTDTANAAKNYRGELHVEILPIRNIELDPENPRDLALSFDDLLSDVLPTNDEFYDRKTKEKETLLSLKNSIDTQGVLNPIIVYKYNEKYRLVAGERRTLASIMAGKQDIPARILTTKPSTLKTSLLQWIENIERADLSLWERLRNIEKIFLAYAGEISSSIDEINTNDIIKLLGCSKPHALNYKTMLNSSPKLREAIKNNLVRSIEKAAFIAKSPEQFTETLIEMCASGATLENMKKYCENNKQNSNKDLSFEKIAGRHSSKVHFGSTPRIDVAKIIIESVLQNSTYRNAREKIGNVNWSDMKSVTKAFKSLLLELENT